MKSYRLLAYFCLIFSAIVPTASHAEFDDRKYLCINQKFVGSMSILYYFSNRSKSDLLNFLIEHFSKDEYKIVIRDVMLKNGDAIFDSFMISEIRKESFEEYKLSKAENLLYMDCMMRRKTDLNEVVEIFKSEY